MSAEQTRRTLNQLDRDLVDLEKKLAEEAKKEADKTKRINDIQRSITKNTSPSMAQSKHRQISSYQKDLERITRTRSEISKKIADKRKRRADIFRRLQKEEADERKKAAQEQQKIYDTYEHHISKLNSHLENALIQKQSESTHLYQQSGNEEYDVFISHASEDKESFADALCQELQNSGISVWYDAISMTWGDSLRSKIDNGLKKSKYGIVILSKDYIKKGWTQYELDGLFQREMTDGKTILPIWHNITKQQVEDFSPTLAGRLALNSVSMTPAEIAGELKKILHMGNNEQEENTNA